jgi:hypothetical protein
MYHSLNQQLDNSYKIKYYLLDLHLIIMKWKHLLILLKTI